MDETLIRALREARVVIEAVRAVGSQGHWDAPHWTLHVPAREANALFDLAYALDPKLAALTPECDCGYEAIKATSATVGGNHAPSCALLRRAGSDQPEPELSRLRELARAEILREHADYRSFTETLNDGGHDADLAANCSHPDCKLLGAGLSAAPEPKE